MSILTPDVLGQVSSLTNYNSNLTTIEASILDIGPFVVSGLVPSAGTGLSVNVSAGVASIGGRVSPSSFVIGGLTDATTNHLYLLNTGAGTSNTTGTQPANSVKLGICVTAAGVVTSVTTSGANRQVKQTQLAPLPGTTDLRTGLIARNVFDGVGAQPLNLNGGQLDAGNLQFAGTIGGSGTPVTLKRFALTFPSDADYTLGTGEKDAYYIDVQTGVISVTRNIIVPGAAGGTYCVINRNAQSVVLKTSGGTGITVATTRAAILSTPGGTNMFRITPDTNYTV